MNWCDLAEKWEQGEADLKDVVIEGVIEGQINELETYLSTKQEEDTDLITKESLEQDCGKYAYDLLRQGNADRASQLLSALKDPSNVSSWLREALLSSLDASVRNSAANHLRSSPDGVTAEDEKALLTISSISKIYTEESFGVAIKNVSHGESRAQALSNAFESLVKGSADLMDDVTGVSTPATGDSLWKGMLGSDSGGDIEQSGESSLFMRLAADWVKDVPPETISRILLEGNARAENRAVEDETEWMAAFQYNLANHNIDATLKMLDSVPDEYLARKTLTVHEDGSEILSFGVVAFDVDVSSASNLLRRLLEHHLLVKGVWLKTDWDSPDSWMSLLAQTGLLLGTTEVPLDLVPLFRSEATARIMVKFASKHGLSHVLQHYLENHDMTADAETAVSLLKSAEGCEWAQWLILSRVPSQASAVAVANARAILPDDAKLETLTDLAERGSLHMTLSTLANFPGPLKAILQAEGAENGHVDDSENYGAQPSVIEGVIRNALPKCDFSVLEKCLQKHPATKNALTDLVQSGSWRGKVSKADYLGWRGGVFGTGGLGFMDLVPHVDKSDFAKLLNFSVGKISGNGDPGEDWEQEAGAWERELVMDMHEWLGIVTATDCGSGAALGVCHHLVSGHPMAALHWYLTNREEQVGESLDLKTLENGHLALPIVDLQLIEKLTRLVSLQWWDSPTVISACMVLASACGLNTATLKVDATVLQKLKDTDCNFQSLVAGLLKEVQENQVGGTVCQEILDILEKISMEESVETPVPDAKIATRRTEGSVDSMDSVYQLYEPNQEIMMQWSLVHAFATIHDLKCSGKLLEELAARDDWILFLAESGAHNYDINQVLEISKTKFSNPRLGHHVCHILRGHSQLALKESGDVDSKDSALATIEVPEEPKGEELFEILVEAEKTGVPGQALLKWACKLNWQLLAIVAASCPDAPLLSCLVAWLDIFAQTDDRTLKYEVDPEGSINVVDRLAWHVHIFCKLGRFDDLMEAFTLFPVIPGALLSRFIGGLSLCAQHMLPAAEQHFRSFQELTNRGDGQDSHGARSADANTPSGRSTVGSSPSLRDLRTMDPVAEADLIDRICRTGALSVLRGLPSPYEKEKLLKMLVRLETREGCTWPEGLRVLLLAYQLLGPAAEEYMVWSGDGASSKPSIRNVREVLETLEDDRKWAEARQWGKANEVNPHEITQREAESLITEWENLGLGEDLHEMLWEEVNEIFLEHEFPPVLAGVFFIQQGVNLLDKGCEEEVHDLLVRALGWLKGQYVEVNQPSVSKLIAELRRALFLMNGDPNHLQKILPNKGFAASGGRYSRSPAVKMILKAAIPPEQSTQAVPPSPAPPPTPTPKPTPAPLPIRSSTPVRSPRGSLEEGASGEETALEKGIELLRKLVDRPSEQVLDKTVKALLDHGEIDEAKKLGNELPFHPINFFLVDTAMAVIHTCGGTGWSGDSVEGIAMGSILNFLKGRRLISAGPAPGPQPVLDAVALACMDSGGQSVCNRAAVTFRSSTVLGISCEELASHGPYEILEMLLGKGDDALIVARKFSDAYELTPRATARMLAQMLLKRLLEDRDVDNVTRRISCEELMSNAVICNDWIEVGNALMQLLLERHSALPSDVEADILAIAYQCYERCEYVEGLDVLLELATSRVEEYASEEMYEALIKLITGLGKYENMQQPLDLLVKQNQLERLLDAAGEGSRTSRAFRSAILSAVHRHRPNDAETLDLAHEFFDMHVEVAKGLRKLANEILKDFAAQGYPARDPDLLQSIDMLMRAAEEYSSVECSMAAAQCWAMVALVAQQACFPDRRWVCLSDSACRDILPQLPDLSPALVVARAYQFNTPQDWVLTLWQHMLEASTAKGGGNLFANSGGHAIVGMQSYSKGVMKEIVIEDQLDQVAQMFIAHRDQEGMYNAGNGVVNKGVLSKCFAQFAMSVMDYEQRMDLCQTVGVEEVQPIIEECLEVLGISHSVTERSGQ
ncbi:hypothetical protein BSKO_01040 [Bryopsis sp. KO-2023]|nr:hypothetical protein BSKO_01040 [Bryopsis sp. KO-2023]